MDNIEKNLNVQNTTINLSESTENRENDEKARELAIKLTECEPSAEDTEEDAVAKNILRALYSGKYKVSIEEPNCVFEKHHPDGTSFFVVYCMDDARSSTNAGSCTVYVGEEEFTCDLNNGEWEYDGEYDLLEYPGIIDALEDADGVIFGENLETEELIATYEAANNCKCSEYYYEEEYDIPMDVDDMTRLSDCGLEEYDDYYLLEEIQDADEEHDNKRWARAALDEPDYYGKYSCIILLFDDEDEQIGEMDCDDMYDAEYGDFE